MRKPIDPATAVCEKQADLWQPGTLSRGPWDPRARRGPDAA
jgi:hypothetical protein